jgi:predicted RNA binding protein YcfA (HicA-like mRNA interferase family)
LQKFWKKEFGFLFVSQKGSHAKYEKIVSGRQIITIVPCHRELARGTLRSVLDLAEIDEKEFWKHV